jgi:hypothetical protein
MLARNSFGVGLLRGLNSAAEVFAPYSGDREPSPLARMRSDWRRLGQDLKAVLGVALASVPEDISGHRLAESQPSRPITSIICAHWSGPLPPPAELERIDRIIPGGRIGCCAWPKKSRHTESRRRNAGSI